MIPVEFKHNHLKLAATVEQEEELKHKLLVTGLAIDVKSYKHIQYNESSNDHMEPPSGCRNGKSYYYCKYPAFIIFLSV